jgi:hypothetical protein
LKVGRFASAVAVMVSCAFCYDVPCGEGDSKCLKRFGGSGEIRTHDLFHAMEARSQLRHRPTACVEVLKETVAGTRPSTRLDWIAPVLAAQENRSKPLLPRQQDLARA